jgi:hypothetical protein
MGHQRDIGRWDATGVEADVGARTGGHVLQGKNPFGFLASQKLGEVAYGLNDVKCAMVKIDGMNVTCFVSKWVCMAQTLGGSRWG